MFENHRILTVIPARGGSKGISKKNLRKIGNRTLVEWALDTARACHFIDRIIVSSDDSTIIRKARKHGPFAPFVRPAELARDESPSLPVFRHALEWLEEEDHCVYDYIVVLEPTCPFRLPIHIQKGIEVAITTKASSSTSLVEVSDQHPVRIKRFLNDGSIEPFCIPEPEGLRRQDQEAAFVRSGAVLVFSRQNIVDNRLWGERPYGFIMDRNLYGINIDEEFDLVAARYLYRKLKKEGRMYLINSTL